MEQKLNLEDWLRKKLSFKTYWQLSSPCSVVYEYKCQLGHPSSYGFVRFECDSSESLSFQSSVLWNQEISEYYVNLNEELIYESIVDGLICSSHTPFFGCSLNLVQIKYDEISSSPVAYYRATKGAIAELIKKGEWKLKDMK